MLVNCRLMTKRRNGHPDFPWPYRSRGPKSLRDDRRVRRASGVSRWTSQGRLYFRCRKFKRLVRQEDRMELFKTEGHLEALPGEDREHAVRFAAVNLL